MKILSIGSDRKLFEPESSVRARVASYGNHVEVIETIVFTGKERLYVDSETNVSSRVRFHPTYSFSRWLYPIDAIVVGRKVVMEHGTPRSHEWVITAQDPFESGFAAWVLSKIFSMPLQLQIHTDIFTPHFRNSSTLNFLRSSIAGFLLPEAARVRVVSESLKELVERKFRIDPEKIDVLPVFVDVENIEKAEGLDLKKVYGEDTLIVLAVGRLQPEKNFTLAIRAFKTLHAFHPKSVFILLGSGPLEDRLRKDAENLGVSGSVIFLGWRDDVYAHYKGADILLLTSDFEGYGMVLIEAAAASLALVSTDVGIAKEFFGSMNAARVCPVGDADCLSRALIQLAESDSARKDAGKRAQEIVRERCSGTLESYALKQTELWSKILY